MPSISYHRLPNSDPFLLSPPRRKPIHFRHLTFLALVAVFLISFLSFYHLNHPSLASRKLDFIAPSDNLSDQHNNHRPALQHAHLSPAHKQDNPSDVQPIHSHPSISPSQPTLIAFSLIIFSENSAAEGAVLIKSIIMHSSSSLAFHIICDGSAQDYLQKRLVLLSHPQHDISVRFYRIPHESMVARIQREGALYTDHAAGVPGLMKLFIHEILPPSVQRAIFVDTDAFFISDPAQLWQLFNTLQPGVAVSMPSHPDQYQPEWHHANRICSCIMLLDLARLRQLRLMDSTHYRADLSSAGTPALAPPAFEAMFGPPAPDGDSGRVKYSDVKLGDQGYWWAIVSHRPDIFQPLSFDWEVSSCLMDMYSTGLGSDDVDEAAESSHQVHVVNTPDHGRAILPKMLHFNCLDGVDRYYDWAGWSDPNDGLAKRWLPAVRFHVGFKWIWLNQPASNASLEMETVRDVKFADELFADGLSENSNP